MKRLLLWLLLSVGAIFFVSCGRKEASFYRLIDTLDKKNIVASPLVGLDSYFPKSVQKSEGKDFRKIELDSQAYWAMPTQRPIACQVDLDIPPGMTVYRDRKEIPFSWTPLANSLSWRWLKGEEGIDFDKFVKRAPTGNFGILGKGEVFARNFIFPPGMARIEISAKSGDSSSYLPRLEVEINGRKARVMTISKLQEYVFYEEMAFGENNIKISFKDSLLVKPRRRSEEPEAVYLRNLKVRVWTDLVLISSPSHPSQLDGAFEFQFASEPVDKIYSVKRSLSSSAGLREPIEIMEGGRRVIDIIFQPLVKDATLTLRLDGNEIGSRKIKGRGWSSLSFLLPDESRSGVLELSLQNEAGALDENKAPDDFFVDSLVVRNPLRRDFLPLYFLKPYRIKDAGSGPNPYEIKKKIKIAGETSNASFAAPPSELRFRTKIPENGRLSFSYGLLTEAGEKEGNGVSFQINLEDAGKAETLFSAQLDPRHSGQRRVLPKDLDLSPYQNKTVTITFKTVSSERQGQSAEEEPNLRNDLAFWGNPYIYRKSGLRPSTEKPINVILISLDTLRADHLGCYGYSLPTSPNIDALAKDSVLFFNTFSQAPYTLSSHMTMMTGLLPTTHQVLYLDQSLDPSVPTLADVLRARGYFTAAFTGGGAVSARYGFAKGFDIYGEVDGANELPNSAEMLFKKTASWLPRISDFNFFLFLHTYQIHNPYKSPAPLGQMFLKENYPRKAAFLQNILGAGFPGLFQALTPVERENLAALYDGEIRYTDEFLIKPLLEDLKKLDLYDETMIVLLSDHGEEFYDHISWEHGHTLYNELLRVPLIVKFPHSKFRGTRIEPYVGLVDLMPTILEEGGWLSGGPKLDGKSLFSLIEGREKKGRTLMSYLPDGMAECIPQRIALIRSPYKLIINQDYPARAYEYFSPPPPKQEAVELYHLGRDPLERKNLADQERNITQEFIKQAEAFLKRGDRGKKSQKFVWDKALEEKLRALGYIK
jgi:arylsulfatase A-like enzyme